AIATCNPGGAGKWREEYSQFFQGKHVVIIRDDDPPGRAHARDVKRALHGIADEVQIVDVLTGKDAFDHLEAGYSLDSFVPAEERFHSLDLGEVIQHGIKPPPFLVEEILYSGKAHAIMGEPGDGKTLIMLGFAVQLIKAGQKVAWIDEENGPYIVASRLKALGANPKEVTENFAYYPFNEMTLADADEFAEEMEMLNPCLVVFDSGADMYVASGLNENDNMDMTKWAIAFLQRLSRSLDIASVVLDHVAKAGDSSYQRGAGAKKAKVDAVWRLEVRFPFDAESVGEVDLVRAKDRLAYLPARLRFQIGGVLGKTVLKQIDIEDEQEDIVADVKRKHNAFRSEVIRILKREGAVSKETGLSQIGLTSLLPPGTKKFKDEVVQSLAHDPTTGVFSGRGARNSILYWLEDG
ncbi:MAG TPA: AAA family ATPase, partial [Ktedonobacteraceae bacterium]